MTTLQGPLDAAVFRPIASVLANWLADTVVRPNHVTSAHLLVGVAGASTVASGRPGLGGAIYLACPILDCLDGQLARRQGTGSAFGNAFDNVVDHLVRLAMFASVAIAAGARGGAWLIVGLAWLSASWLVALADAEIRCARPRPEPDDPPPVEDRLLLRAYAQVAGALLATIPGLSCGSVTLIERGATWSRTLAIWAGSGTQAALLVGACLTGQLWPFLSIEASGGLLCGAAIVWLRRRERQGRVP